MGMSMALLLVHSMHIPAEARDALREAYQSVPEERVAKLEAAARVLHRSTGLECRDARELVGLPT